MSEASVTALRVTVKDGKTGDTEIFHVAENDYWIIATGTCEVVNVTAHANGTHVLTIKGRGGRV